MDCINEMDEIKSLIDNGSFGDVHYVTSKLENDVERGTHFASLVNFFTLTVNDGMRDINHYIVTKKPHLTESRKVLFNSNISFENEVIMYTEVLPLLDAKRLNLFPKLYQTSTLKVSTDLLILENLHHKGFTLTKEKLLLDLEHVELILMKLAQFHALSYLAKRNNKETFISSVYKLKESKFTGGTARFLKPVHACMLRGIQPLIEENIQVELLNQVIKKLENMNDVVLSIIKPEEPFSVVCHGDFCRNNIFFKYDASRPVDVKFFDLQNSLYTSPVVDITFFLYLNTTAEMRDKYWDRFMETYWKSLINSVPDLEFTFEQFLEHFSKRAVYGYIPTSFFLPLSLFEKAGYNVEHYEKLSIKELVKQLSQWGGDEGTSVVSNIVKHLLSKRFLHKFLEL